MLIYCQRNKRAPQELTVASIAIGGGDDDKTCQNIGALPTKTNATAPKCHRPQLQNQQQQKKEPKTLSTTIMLPQKEEPPMLQPQQPPQEDPKRKSDNPVAAMSSPHIITKNLEGKATKKSHRGGGHVRFHSVELKEYALTVGDHPLCKILPLTLDWSHSKPIEFNINEYEASRTAKLELHMDVRDRFERLTLVSGMSEHAVADLEQTRRQSQRRSE